MKKGRKEGRKEEKKGRKKEEAKKYNKFMHSDIAVTPGSD